MIRVMIADDEPLILKNLTSIIHWEDLGCEVVATAKNGMDIIDILKNEPIDLLLTDISMPKMTGVEVLKTIHDWKSPPLAILLSGYDEFSYAREGLKYNALDYFLKPIDYEELESCIQKAVDEIHLKEEQWEKQALFERIMKGTNVVDEESPFSYVVMVVKDSDHEMDVPPSSDIKVYSYPLNPTHMFLVLRGEEQGALVEQAERLASEMVASSRNVIFAIGRAVRGIMDCKKSFEEAESILKFSSFAQERVLTKSLVDKRYGARTSAIDAVDQAAEIVSRQFQEDLSIDQVADEVGVSVSYFSQLFKKKYHMTFLEYLRRTRMDHACLLLTTSELETYRIAEKVGYTDQRYFSQVFKKTLGVTPTQYRKQHQS
ncbi:response regulator [Halobacillus litoralis]|uniref:response regulator n=1 Tax=Halobacillus litoralis TaxID=45668 RepID=UPI001CD23D20|nr:response regulator [Halobacillus litoralis]MCA0972103.1 response regulator [Halobacillus litoralis]